jgi:hypothetical protein
MERRELVKVAERRSLLTATTAAGRRSSRGIGFGQIVGAALAAVGRQAGRPAADRPVPAA